MVGNEHLHMREQFAMEADATSLAFKKKHIERLENSKRFKSYRSPDIIYMAGDPAGGGKSEFGISAAYFDGGVMVVCYHLIKSHPVFFEDISLGNILFIFIICLSLLIQALLKKSTYFSI